MKRIWLAAVGMLLTALALTGCQVSKQITVPANSDTTCTVHTVPGGLK